MASMLSRGALLAECLVKNSAPKVNRIIVLIDCGNVCKGQYAGKKKAMVYCHVS